MHACALVHSILCTHKHPGSIRCNHHFLFVVDCVFEFVRATEYEMQFTDPIERREEDDEDTSEQKGNATADESGNKKQTKSKGAQGVSVDKKGGGK